MILIILYAIQQMPSEKNLTHWLILSGLIFGMIGDGTLHWFLIGLSAFLINHIFYIAGFILQYRFTLFRFCFILPLLVASYFIGNRLLASLSFDGNESLFIPILFYIIVIMFMAWFAMMTGNKWVVLGSVLFVISDSILAWDMFVEPIYLSGVLVMIPYYSAQFFIAHSLKTISSPLK